MTAALQSRGELPPTTAAGIAEVKALEAFNETMPPADVPNRGRGVAYLSSYQGADGGHYQRRRGDSRG